MNMNDHRKHISVRFFMILTMLLSAVLLSGCTISIRTGEKAAAPENGASSLREAVSSDEGLGEDAVIGACISSASINDDDLWRIATENFNAFTLENELKPDAMFGYHNDAVPAGSVHEEELNGKKIMVPTLDHSRADAILDRIAEWNRANPQRMIKARGHVLVWHSQTPEWFFHVDYDKNKDYVSPGEMDERLEWYIKSVLEYYTGPGSRYEGLFYGWDVVNEAVSDRTGTYRTDTESGSDSLADSVHSSKSSWWKVYGSNEYIINAFRFANRYAPSDLDLYYNDYNECDKKKQKGITALIEDVKAADGTRIDGFGMQGHYSVFFPTEDQIKEAAYGYAEVVDKIMLTELDVGHSMLYNGTKEALPEEYMRQAKYYAGIYEVFTALHAEGINTAGISLWGVSDKYTWRQGEAPLLFDEDNEPKPAYEAFINPSGFGGE